MFIALVLPGVFEVLAKFLVLHTALITELLPTFDLPTNATSDILCGKSSGFVSDIKKLISINLMPFLVSKFG